MAIKGYWRLNGNSNDASGSGYNGTDANITYSQANGLLNGGAGFNGSSSTINVGNAGQFGTGDFTVLLIFKTTQNTTGRYPNMIGTTKDIAPRYGFSLLLDNYTTSSVIYFELLSNAGYAYVSSVDNFRDGKWHIAVGIKTSTKAYLYIDSKLKDTQDHTLGTISGGVGCYMGRSAGSAQNYYNGALDQALLDSTAWNVAKVKNEYSRIKGFF